MWKTGYAFLIKVISSWLKYVKRIEKELLLLSWPLRIASIKYSLIHIKNMEIKVTGIGNCRIIAALILIPSFFCSGYDAAPDIISSQLREIIFGLVWFLPLKNNQIEKKKKKPKPNWNQFKTTSLGSVFKVQNGQKPMDFFLYDWDVPQFSIKFTPTKPH